ncbi:sensor domain-containing diguanylate cyclase [Vibrio sp. SCSIO 43136]|uniref:GGDEF domain-containing protein n=1 Tax=Vibrio sp. SCSIO 43136 TaxID=2819101 RepID=UPI00207537CF|nr:sensor domain-containing diguanylate cyclase [Vibrio sp. SCSIO 43136]USD64433.1 diguanylate cyclase [Vibrio sp. SCSIO 43136]
MLTASYFNSRVTFVIPTLLALISLAVITTVYWFRAKDHVFDEFHRVEQALVRAAKVVSALDYNLSNQLAARTELNFAHRFELSEGLCSIEPTEAYVRVKEKQDNIPAINIDYLIKSEAKFCLEADNSREIGEKLSLAPLLSFLNDIDPNIARTRYIDRAGYVVSSPGGYARQLNKSQFDMQMQSPYWFTTTQFRTLIDLEGPSHSDVLGEQVLSLVTAVYRGGEHQGILSIDLNLFELLGQVSLLHREVGLREHRALDKQTSIIWRRDIKIDGLMTNHELYYSLDWEREFHYYFEQEKYGLLLIFVMYLMVILFLKSVNSKLEKDHFQKMAYLDPLTGILNRRGLEKAWQERPRTQHIGVMLIDIDNFKLINDSMGHDCGDEVIRFVAKNLLENINPESVVARFGGEEFVVILNAPTRKQLNQLATDIHAQVTKQSYQVIEQGFTTSGGISVAADALDADLEKLLKAADNRLYRAKNNGKDQLVW